MKKLISVMALLLVLATLLSSCGVNLAKANMADYVSLADGTHTSVKLTVDRTNVYKESVRQAIYEALRGKAGTDKTGDETFEKFDTVQLHTVIFNQKGEIVSTSLSVKIDSTKDQATSFGDAESISLGFGANREVLADIEAQLLDAVDVKYVKNHLFTPTISEKDKVSTNSILLVTYTASTASVSGTAAKTSSPVILPGHMYAANADNSGFKDGFEKDPYLAAIYQALEDLSTYKESEDATEYKYAPVVNKAKDAITITVKPTSEKPADHKNGTTGAGAVTVYADISFDTSNDKTDADGKVTEKTFEEGKIYTTVRGMIGGEGKTFITADNIVIYEKDDKEEENEDALEGELDVIVLPVKVTPYPDMIEYDNPTSDEEIEALTAFIKTELEKKGITPETDLAKLKAQFEQLTFDKLDEELGYYAKAEETAKNKIWAEIVKKATVLKYPEKNVRDYVKDQEEILEYMYYNGEYPSIGYYHSWSVYQGAVDKDGFKLSPKSVTSIPASETGKYKNWKEYAADQYDEETYSGVRSQLYEEGYAREKEMMMTYYMAEKLGITIDDAKYNELIKADAEAWIKQQKENYEEQLDYAPTITVADYEEAMGGKEMLRGAHLLKLVKDELFKITVDKGGLTYNDLYPDGDKVEK